MLAMRSLVLTLVVAAVAIAGGMAEEPVASLAVDELGTTTMRGGKKSDSPADIVLTGNSDLLKSGKEGDDGAEQAVSKNDNVGELTFGGDEPPAGLTLTGERDMLTSPDAASEGDKKEAHEMVGLYRRRFYYPGFRRGYYGWRYPLPYWRRYGRRFYGGPCPFGRIYGDYYYC